MATKVRDITNNKFKNAIRAAGWSQAKEFYKDFNLPPSTLQSWAGGHRQTIFDIRTDIYLVLELCKIFDCSKDELNGMVSNAYRIKHGHPEEEPEKVPLGDKDATFARYLACDEKKNEQPISSNGAVPLEDWLKSQQNGDFFEEHPEVVSDRDEKFNKEEDDEVDTEDKKYEWHPNDYTKENDEMAQKREPKACLQREVGKAYLEETKLEEIEFDLIAEALYGTVSYRKYRRILNVIKKNCM